jgi:hypothetical protein
MAMGQFSRTSEPRVQTRRPMAGREGNAWDVRTPYEWKYFVLALAALIGLGLGWLSGKAVTGWLPDESPPLAVAAHAAPMTTASPQAATPEDGEADVTASVDPDESAAAVAQATTDEPPRAGRKAARRAHWRHARGNFFSRALHRLRIWGAGESNLSSSKRKAGRFA